MPGQGFQGMRAEPSCASCRWAQDSADGLLCLRHQMVAADPCDDYEREPGSDVEERIIWP